MPPNEMRATAMHRNLAKIRVELLRYDDDDDDMLAYIFKYTNTDMHGHQ